MIIKIMILPFKPEKITIRIVGLSVITFKFETRRAKRTFEAEEIYVCYADKPAVRLSAVNVRNAVYSAALNEAGTRNSRAISETSALTGADLLLGVNPCNECNARRQWKQVFDHIHVVRHMHSVQQGNTKP